MHFMIKFHRIETLWISLQFIAVECLNSCWPATFKARAKRKWISKMARQSSLGDSQCSPLHSWTVFLFKVLGVKVSCSLFNLSSRKEQLVAQRIKWIRAVLQPIRMMFALIMIRVPSFMNTLALTMSWRSCTMWDTSLFWINRDWFHQNELTLHIGGNSAHHGKGRGRETKASSSTYRYGWRGRPHSAVWLTI